MKLLLVEDEPFVALDLETMLVRLGHQVVGVAETRSEAFELADATRPEAALIDVRLRDGFTGAEIARRLGADGVRCAFVTGNAEQLPADLCGAAGVVGKPFTEASISALLTQMSDPSPATGI